MRHIAAIMRLLDGSSGPQPQGLTSPTVFHLLALLVICPAFKYLANHLEIFRWTMASVLFLASWAVMMGPVQYGMHFQKPSCPPCQTAYIL